MILPNYESMRVNFAIRAYGATPARGPDGRFLFPSTVAAYPTTGMLARNVVNSSVAGSEAAAKILPWEFTTNARLADAVARTDEWDWYLWHDAGWLELRRDPEDSLSSTYSGSAWLYLTAAGLAEYPDATIGFPPDSPAFQRTVAASSLRRLLRSSYVYAQRRSDGAVRIFDLSALVFGGSVGNVLPES